MSDPNKKLSDKYKGYINSVPWYEKRSLVLMKHGNKCFKCGSKRCIQIHHVTYQRLGKEDLSDLLPLCKNCHKKIHGIKYKFIRKGKKKLNKNKLDEARIKNTNYIKSHFPFLSNPNKHKFKGLFANGGTVRVRSGDLRPTTTQSRTGATSAGELATAGDMNL